MALSKSNLGLGNAMIFLSLVISIVTLLLLLAGFVRIEFKLNDQGAKLAAVERLCTAQTDVSQDDAADVKGKTDDMSVFWLRSLLQKSIKCRVRESLELLQSESKNTPIGKC